MKILVTGGSGFIGSELVRHLITNTEHEVFNIDKLTYAANQKSLENISENKRYAFKQLDICDFQGVQEVFNNFKPDAIMHLAAESHVDKSITGSDEFIESNIIGTYNLLKCSRNYVDSISGSDKFRFLHVSTDEVYGSLNTGDEKFKEESVYQPNSPYSASKAASDHLVRAWGHTFNLPVITTHCSNNYGPWQNEEKLIPLMISNALNELPLPVYGDGQNIRDWIYVTDHVVGLVTSLIDGKPGEVYNFGGENEIKNIDIVNTICDILDNKRAKSNGSSYKELITFVKDRPGHDFRYAVDNSKVNEELNWFPKESFTTGIEKTIDWYLRES